MVASVVAAFLQITQANATPFYFYDYHGLPFQVNGVDPDTGDPTSFTTNVNAEVIYNGNAQTLNGTYNVGSGQNFTVITFNGVGRASATMSFKNGVVESWEIIEDPGPVVTTTTTGGDSFDTRFASGFNSTPGTWTVSPSLVPLPAALPLFVTGLGMMGFIARRRRK